MRRKLFQLADMAGSEKELAGTLQSAPILEPIFNYVSVENGRDTHPVSCLEVKDSCVAHSTNANDQL